MFFQSTVSCVGKSFRKHLRILRCCKVNLADEWIFVKLGVSFLSINLTGVLMAFTTLLFAGQIDKAHLDGVGLANSLYGAFILSLSSGYSSVFDTYGPQVYGSGEKAELGTVLVKCLLQGGLVHLLILGPYLNLVYLINILPASLIHGDTNSGHDFREIAVQYLRITASVEYLDYSVTMICKYFAIQGQTRFVYVVSVIMVVTHIAANYLLVSVLRLGVIGLGMAAIIGRLAPLLVSVIICVVKVRRGQLFWSGLGVKTLLGWRKMIRLGVSGAFNCFAEMALYEISTFCSQFAGSDSLSVVIILAQIVAIWWAIAFSLSRTAATLIGKALGEGNTQKVKTCIKITLINTTMESLPLAFVSLLLRKQLVQIFSTDTEIVALYDSTFWITCLGLPINHFMNTLNQGILVAFGQQRFIAWTMSIASYAIALPFISLTIFYTDIGVVGVMLGWIISDFICLLTAAYKVYKLDIEKEIGKANARVKKCREVKIAEKFSRDVENCEISVLAGRECSFVNSELEVADKEEKRRSNDFSVNYRLKRFMENEPRMVTLLFVTCVVICSIFIVLSFIGSW